MSISNNHDLALPVGSLILVTGANGYIASNIVREALDLGYRVRGTVRSEEKAEDAKKTFNSALYETTVVPNMQTDDAFDEAIKGVDGIIHTASVMTMSPNPHEVIPPTVEGVVSILKSAIKEPKVKRFVFTSSSLAAASPKPGTKSKIDKNTWNTELEQYTDFQPPYTNDMSFLVYSIGKVRAEREVWKFVKEQKPGFAVNCILPDFNTGRILTSGGITGGMVQNAFKGNIDWDFLPRHMINVVDDARVHVAAVIDRSLANERIFAYDSPFNWNDILAVFRELRPDMKFPEPKPDIGEDLSEVDNALGAQLLKKWWGQDGYVGLKESIRQNIEGM